MLTETENMIAHKVGIAYARQYALMVMDADIPDIMKLLEETVKAIGISVGEAVAHYELLVDEDHSRQICDRALAEFMTACDKSCLFCCEKDLISN